MWLTRSRFAAALLMGMGLAQGMSGPLVRGQDTKAKLPATLLPPVAPAVVSAGDSGVCLDVDQRRPRTWGSAEYLLWWIKDGPQSLPLATTGSPTDAFPGALGQPNTRVLFGGNGLDYGTFSGMRLTIGGWRDCEQSVGLEMSGFLLEKRGAAFSAFSDGAGNPPIYVPIFRPELGREGAFAISDPLLLGGIGKDLHISSYTQLWGAELNGVFNRQRDACSSLDFLVGVRYLDLKENISLNAFLTEPAGTFVVNEGFNTNNQFYGAQLGVRKTWQRDILFAEVTGKLAMGVTHQTVGIVGSTVQTTPAGAVNTFNSGIFTQPSNIGQTSKNMFAVVPEVQFKIGVDVTSNVRAFVSYNFLYVSSVVRPGDQIDRVVNETQSTGAGLVGPARPSAFFDSSDFWTHGLGFGVEFKY